MRNSIFTGIFLLAMLTVACQRSAYGPPAATSPPVGQQQDLQILFVNLEILKDSVSGEVTVKLLNTMVANGRVKEAPAEPVTAAAGDLVCNFRDNQDNTLTSIIVANPLEQTLEYSTEAGTFEKKTLKLQRATFSLRTQIKPGTATLQVQQMQPSRQLKNITSIALSI